MKIDAFQVKMSITHKIMLHVIIVVFVAVGINTYLAVKMESKVLTEALIWMGKNLAGNIASSTENAFWSLNWIYIEKQLEKYSKKDQGNVLLAKIVKPNGEVYLASDKAYYGTVVENSLLSDKEIVLKNYFWPEIGSDKKKQGYLIVHPFTISHDKWYVVLGLSLEQVNAAVRDLIFRNLCFGGLIVCLGILGSYFLSKSISRPITDLAGVAKHISEGNWEHIHVDSKDEVGRLGDAFNRMINNLKTATAELRTSEEKYRNIIENSTEGFFQITPHGLILTANPAFAKIKGFDSPDEMMANIADISAQFYTDIIQQEQFKSLIRRQGFVKDFETEICRRDNTIIYVTINARAVMAENHHLLYYEGIMQDVTRKKEIEALKIDKRVAEAKAKAKSSFLANMSHEIRTPLNIILGYSELLKDNLDKNLQNEYLENIISSGRLLLSLIDDILDLSKTDSGKITLNIKPMSISSVLDDIKSQFAGRMASKGLFFSIQSDFEIKDLSIAFDEVRFRQIVNNLIDNAYKYTETGYVRVSVHIDKIENRYLDFSMTVLDSGVGMTDTAIIFEEFEQLQNDKTLCGAGLGLSIVKRLVDLLHGSVTVESEPSKGSIFTVAFKQVEVIGEIDSYKENEPLEKINFEPARLLVVDDKKKNRDLIKDYLKPYNISIFEAKNGMEAIETASKNTIDLLLLDLKMPIMDGFETARRIKSKEQLKHIPIIVFTADVTEESKEEVLAAGCDGYILKPVGSKSLLRELKRFLVYTLQESVT